MTEYKCTMCRARLQDGDIAVGAPIDFSMSRSEAMVEGDLLCGPEGTSISACLHDYKSMEGGADVYVTTLEDVKVARQPEPKMIELSDGTKADIRSAVAWFPPGN